MLSLSERFVFLAHVTSIWGRFEEPGIYIYTSYIFCHVLSI